MFFNWPAVRNDLIGPSDPIGLLEEPGGVHLWKYGLSDKNPNNFEAENFKFLVRLDYLEFCQAIRILRKDQYNIYMTQKRDKSDRG